VEAWAAIEEAKARPARVRLALRLLKAFLRWAAAEPDLKDKGRPGRRQREEGPRGCRQGEAERRLPAA
jgi:hypothetical protein